MKKKIGIVVAIILLTLLVFVLVGVVLPMGFSFLSFNDTELTDIEKIQKVITETHKTDVLLMGKDIQFSTNVPCRKIATISEAELERVDECQYTILIINDMSDNVDLSVDDQEILKNLIAENDFCLIYLGSKYSTTWDDPTQPLASVEGNLFYMYYSIDGQPYSNIGSWRVQDQEQLEMYPDSLGETLMYSFEYYLECVN